MGYHKLDYYNENTLDEINQYVYDNIDTSDWSRCDMVRVATTKKPNKKWQDVSGLFFWDGERLVFPFYNGRLGEMDTHEYNFDQMIDRFGYIPNLFQVIHDFHPSEPVSISDGISHNQVMFTNLSKFSNQLNKNVRRYTVSNNFSDNDIISITSFKDYDYNITYYVLVLGEMTSQVRKYFNGNHPYDFDLNLIADEYEFGATVDEIKDEINFGDYDQIMFIHPGFLGVNFNVSSYGCYKNYHKSNHSGKYKGTQPNFESSARGTRPKFVNQKQKNKCIGSTNKGGNCTRMAKNGSDYCGIHLRAMQETGSIDEEIQCISTTGKGKRCNRMAKVGYDYCGVHLRIYS